LEKLSALGEPARACAPQGLARVVCLPGRSGLGGDLIGGEASRGVRGADTVIHLAGVTKALAARDYYAGNVRPRKTLLAPLWRGAAYAWCM